MMAQEFPQELHEELFLPYTQQHSFEGYTGSTTANKRYNGNSYGRADYEHFYDQFCIHSHPHRLPTEPLPPPEEEESTMRGYLLLQQQNRIFQLEKELQGASEELKGLKEKLTMVTPKSQKSTQPKLSAPKTTTPKPSQEAKKYVATYKKPPVAVVKPPASQAQPAKTKTLKANISSHTARPQSGARPAGGNGKEKSDASIISQSRYWTPAEHQRFLEALEKYGPKDVKAIAGYVKTRTPTQVRTHAQKFYLRLYKETDPNESKEGRARTRQTAMIVPPDAAVKIGIKRKLSTSSGGENDSSNPNSKPPPQHDFKAEEGKEKGSEVRQKVPLPSS